jgi:heme/copper-type cytochrome/quinol oxidase subunit 2
MRNENILKIANVLSVFVIMSLLLMPLVVGAQFELPNPDNSGVADDETATDFIFRIIQILLAVAGLVAVIFLVVGGFRYITAGGNEEAAETAKKSIVNSIIGIVIIILAFVIVRVIANALIEGPGAGV